MKVLVFGSLNYDNVYMLDHIVNPGETIHSQCLQTFCGGKGLNQAIAAARAGCEVYLAGTVGEDGEQLLQVCSKSEVDISYVAKALGKSGHAIIQVDSLSQNSIVLYGGANWKQEQKHIDEVISKFEQGDILLLQNEINELAYIIDTAKKRNMKIVLNPSPFDETLRQCDFSKIDVFMMNEVEGEQISGYQEPEQILEYMKQHFPHAKTVLTLGTKGAVYQEQGKIIRQPAHQTEAVDTTAAGDTFTGYFIGGMAEGRKMKEILNRCAFASAIAVSRMGAATSIPNKEAVDRAMRY